MNKNEINGGFHFPQSNLEKIDLVEELKSARKRIYDAQNSGQGTQECFLSFYPVAKNIRFVSSHFYNAIKNNRMPILSDRARLGEDSFWREMTEKSWYPWLWTRYFNDSDENEGNKRSWSRIFNNVEDISVNEDIDPNLYNSDSFFLYLACLSHVFKFNDGFKKYLFERYKADFPEGPVCALQIRRGEIVPKDGDINKSWKIRDLFTLDQYMERTKEVCNKIGTNKIFVSSDSSETIEYLAENYPEYDFISNKYDRNLFVRFQGDPSKVNLERDLQLNPGLIQHYTETCLIDLYMLSQCQGFVGGMRHSEYGVCGWFLQMAEQNAITPYYNLEGEFELDGFPVGMLLN
jgi:hypothetical protein